MKSVLFTMFAVIAFNTMAEEYSSVELISGDLIEVIATKEIVIPRGRGMVSVGSRCNWSATIYLTEKTTVTRIIKPGKKIAMKVRDNNGGSLSLDTLSAISIDGLNLYSPVSNSMITTDDLKAFFSEENEECNAGLVLSSIELKDINAAPVEIE